MNLKDLKPTERFSDRVEDYVRFRPSYPASLLDYLETRLGSLKGKRVADVGAGTGILAALLLDRGAEVFAVEPNKEMRAAATRALTTKSGFHACEGSAENTGLPNASFDLITSAQAFHWFDPERTRQECDRILVAGGHIAIIWNNQEVDSPLGAGYESVRRNFGGENFKDVMKVTKDVELALEKFFAKSNYEFKIFENDQRLTREGFIGRFFSSSYAPAADSPLREPARQELERLFDLFQSGGHIHLAYKTELFLGA